MVKEDRVNYVGQIYGNRIIIKNYCERCDWEVLGREVPKHINKYRLSECLICGGKVPVLIKNVMEHPPKHCPYCSNYRSNNTNSWYVFEDYAVCNIIFHGEIVSFYIDIDDYDRAKARVWRVSKKKNKFYASSGNARDKSQVYLHKFILQCDVADGYEIDHIDGNSQNNRKSNLRVVTRLQNIQNSKVRIDSKIGIRGIVKNRDKFSCDFSFNNKRFYFRDWDSLEEAVYCRKFVEEYFGLEIIVRNPLATKYFVLPVEREEEIRLYVTNKIEEILRK